MIFQIYKYTYVIYTYKLFTKCIFSILFVIWTLMYKEKRFYKFTYTYLLVNDIEMYYIVYL